jgi:hypothetical protein
MPPSRLRRLVKPWKPRSGLTIAQAGESDGSSPALNSAGASASCCTPGSSPSGQARPAAPVSLSVAEGSVLVVVDASVVPTEVVGPEVEVVEVVEVVGSAGPSVGSVLVASVAGCAVAAVASVAAPVEPSVEPSPPWQAVEARAPSRSSESGRGRVDMSGTIAEGPRPWDAGRRSSSPAPEPETPGPAWVRSGNAVCPMRQVEQPDLVDPRLSAALVARCGPARGSR